MFPIINSHINSGEAWIWHLSIVLRLEWVHSFTIQGKDGTVWKQETNKTWDTTELHVLSYLPKAPSTHPSPCKGQVCGTEISDKLLYMQLEKKSHLCSWTGFKTPVKGWNTRTTQGFPLHAFYTSNVGLGLKAKSYSDILASHGGRAIFSIWRSSNKIMQLTTGMPPYWMWQGFSVPLPVSPCAGGLYWSCNYDQRKSVLQTGQGTTAYTEKNAPPSQVFLTRVAFHLQK